MEIISLTKGIASPYGNVDAEYINPTTENPWSSVQEYITYKNGKFSNPPKHKTILVKQDDGTNAEMTNENQPNVNTFVLKQSAFSGGSNDGEESSISIVDNLNSESSTDALSAKQGKVLDFKISQIKVNNSKVTIMQQGEKVGEFTLNQDEPTTIDVGEGQEKVFTAGMLYRVLMGRCNNKVYLTSGFDVSPNISTYNGFAMPSGQTGTGKWCGAGTAPVSDGNKYVCIHNVNVDAWKGRKFIFKVGDGYKMAIASGTVNQTGGWSKPYPQESDLPWSWHTAGEEIEITIGDMISIMIMKADGSAWNWDYSYAAVWNMFSIRESEDSVANPPVKLKDSRYAGHWIGIMGDSILAGASTTAYKTAVDVLVSDFGIIPVLRAQAGTCISEPNTEWGDRADGRFSLRVDNVFRTMASGTIYVNGSVTQEPSRGVLIMGVNDILMCKHPIEEHPFIRKWVKTKTNQVYTEIVLNIDELTSGGYLQSLEELSNNIKSGLGSAIGQMYLVGPYMCQWPGNYGMSTCSKNPNGDTGEDFIRIQKQYCMVKGWSYLNILGSQLNTFLPGWSNDNLHPNQRGHQMLGEHLGQLVCGTMLTQNEPVFYEKVEIEDKNGGLHTILQEINNDPGENPFV